MVVSLTDLKQKQWVKACEKLGLVVDRKSGKGSHVRVYHPTNKNLRPMTIPCHTHKIISASLYKILFEWGFTEEEVDKALK